ncbi:MAG: flagellar biosynthesis anti-sigma factor FlgM [Candidatus Krumholzibacteriota bacterium]|nr:flagellar biosynthesis anti-sigma factor FlgM [Candidatus Krumholzibacteriota bacterium]
MKINNIRYNKLDDMTGKKEVEKNATKESPVMESSEKKRSTISTNDLSKTGKLISKAWMKLDSITEVREEKIAEIKAKLADGYYDSDEVKEETVARLAEHLKRITDR